MAGQDGWVEVSEQACNYAFDPGFRGGHSVWTKLRYKVGPFSANPDGPRFRSSQYIPGEHPNRYLMKSRRSSLTPRLVRMIIARFYPTGVVEEIQLYIKGELNFEPQVSDEELPSDVPPGDVNPYGVDVEREVVDMTSVDGRSLDQVLDAAEELDLGILLKVEIKNLELVFQMDEDYYFWVSTNLYMSSGRGVNLQTYPSRFYRADLEDGLESLIGHLIRTGPNWVPASMLGLAEGDRVDHEKYGPGVVLRMAGGMCRLRFDDEVWTKSNTKVQEVDFSMEKLRLRMAPVRRR